MKKFFTVFLALILTVSTLCSCQKTRTEIISGEDSYYDEIVYASGTESNTDSSGNSSQNNNTSNNSSKGTSSSSSTVPPEKGHIEGAGELTFTPVEDKGADYSVSGTVKIAVDTVRVADYAAMFDVLQKLYPNIKIKFDYWSHSSSDSALEYLSTRAKTGTMADIIWDDAGTLPSYLTQGWVRPITEFVSNDPEYANVPENLKSGYTYCGEVYALPHQATFEITAFNTDVLKKMNKSMPDLKWMADTFENLLSAGASKFQSGLCVGIDNLFSTATWYGGYLAHKAGKDLTILGYNYSSKQCDDISYYVEGALMFRKWRTMASGVEGWQEAQTGALQERLGVKDYTKLWQSGKCLLKQCGTYDTPNWTNVKSNWKQWTVPNTDGSMPFHVDHCFITSQCKDENAAAAFQVLRFITYSTNGNLARLSMYDDENKGKYALNSHIYYPTTVNAKVIEKFNSLSCADEVDKYLLANISKCYRIDPYKIVPEWNNLTSKYVSAALNKVTDGLDTTGEGLTEARVKMNSGLKDAWRNFETELKKVQVSFNSTHKR